MSYPFGVFYSIFVFGLLVVGILQLYSVYSFDCCWMFISMYIHVD